MDFMKAGVDDLGAIIFVLYIVISIFQAIFKKKEPEDAGNGPPEKFDWDEEVTYDGSGQPVKRTPQEAKPEPARPAPQPPAPVPVPQRKIPEPKIPGRAKDPYGVLTGKEGGREEKPRRPMPPPSTPRMPPAPRRAERPRQDNGWQSSEEGRDSRETAREARDTTRNRGETSQPPPVIDTRETMSEHRHRDVKPEISGSTWGEVFRSHEQPRARAMAAVAGAAAKAAARRAPAAGSPASPATEFVKLLQNPRTAATAVLAGEILGPPVSMRGRRRR